MSKARATVEVPAADWNEMLDAQRLLAAEMAALREAVGAMARALVMPPSPTPSNRELLLAAVEGIARLERDVGEIRGRLLKA